MDPLLLVAVLVVAGVLVVGSLRLSPRGTRRAARASRADNTPRTFDLKRKRYFFSRTEKEFYSVLLEALEGTDITVFAQVRLIELFVDDPGRKQVYNNLSQMHVDFVLIGWPDGTPLCVIEVDGPSHDNATQRARDEKKNNALASAGIPLLRVRNEALPSALELKKVLETHLTGNHSRRAGRASR